MGCSFLSYHICNHINKEIVFGSTGTMYSVFGVKLIKKKTYFLILTTFALRIKSIDKANYAFVLLFSNV